MYTEGGSKIGFDGVGILALLKFQLLNHLRYISRLFVCITFSMIKKVF